MSIKYVIFFCLFFRSLVGGTLFFHAGESMVQWEYYSAIYQRGRESGKKGYFHTNQKSELPITLQVQMGIH